MTYNFKDHKKGDTFSGVQFSVIVNGQPADLTNAQIRMQLKESVTTIRPAVAEFSVANNKIEITDALAGEFFFKKQVIDVPAKKYVYDIQIIFANGDIKTWIQGTWNILQDFTN
jgi:hypothetical protein